MKNLFNLMMAGAILLVLNLGCSSLKNLGGQNTNVNVKTTTTNASPSASDANSTVADNSSTDTDSTSDSAEVVNAGDKADFTMTAEQAFKAFKDDKNPIKGEKYVDKILEISGRFKDIDTSKKDSTGGYSARLNAGGMFDWIGCSVDEAQKDQFTKIAKDQMVTFKGLGDRFWLAGPRLKHCIVIVK